MHQVVLSGWGLWPHNFRAINKFDGAVCVGGFQDVSILKFIYRDGRLLFCLHSLRYILSYILGEFLFLIPKTL